MRDFFLKFFDERFDICFLALFELNRIVVTLVRRFLKHCKTSAFSRVFLKLSKFYMIFLNPFSLMLISERQ